MKCAICRHGETQPGTVTVTLERGGATVVIKEVPARLLKTAEDAIRTGVQVDVRTYAAA